MGLLYRKVKKTLAFKEGQPEIYKISSVIFPVVTFAQLVSECSKSCGVNPSQTQSVVSALLDRMVHYMELGHGVKLGSFGSFKPTINVKAVTSAEDATADTIQQKKILFRPGKDFKDMLSDLDVRSAGESLDKV